MRKYRVPGRSRSCSGEAGSWDTRGRNAACTGRELDRTRRNPWPPDRCDQRRMFAADPTVEATAVSVSCDRGLWLQERCLNCRATPSAQCGVSSFSRTSQPTPLHVARGWRARTCPTYKALPGDHVATTLDARLRTGIRRGSDRGGTSSRRASRCGRSSSARRDDHIGSIQRPRRPGWSRRQDHAAPARRRKLVDVERWTGRDELCYPLEGPVWDRFGSFAGQPQIAGTVVWTTARSARGDRGSTRRSALQRASVTNTDAVHHHVPAGLDWKAISAAPATDEKTASAEPETPAYLGPWQPDD